MSALIFPNLSGLDIKIKRTPLWSTEVLTAESGKEQRASWWSGPRYRFTVALNFLRQDKNSDELATLEGFFHRHRGQFDSFLLTDPKDSSVTDHGFGAGDGTTTAFQLQRTTSGPVTDILGTWQAYTKPRTNYMTGSQALAGWGKANSGTGSAPVVTDNYAAAPDGTITAARIQSSRGAGTTAADYSYVLNGYPAGKCPPGPGTISLWARSNTGANQAINVQNAHNGTGSTLTITPTWQRFTIPITVDGVGDALYFVNAGTYSAVTANQDYLVWGVQWETGSVATRYMPTTTLVGTTATPAYYPAGGDGFEPITEPAPGVTIYRTDWQGKQLLYPTPRTNLLAYSEQLDQWLLPATAGVTANATTAPDGANTADKIIEINTTSAEHYTEKYFTAADGTTVTLSAYFKAAERTWAFLAFVLKDNASVPGVYANLTTATLGTVTAGYTATITAVGNGWYRLTLTGSVGAGGANPRIRVQSATGDMGKTYAGTVNNGIYCWGGQAEASTAATSYIVTAAAPVTVTDYTLGSSGLVTFATAPVAGAALSWTGSYFYRVRFDMDEAEFEREFSRVWNAKTIKLVSVK